MSLSTNREATTRRDCLRLGMSALVGGGLADALRLPGMASASLGPTPAASSCILVWMDGGPSHYETFDPKPDAPAEIRGKFDPIATRLPGVHFSAHMRRLAAIADKLAIVRSIRHDQGNHGAANHSLMTGAPPRTPVGGAFVSLHPSLGSATPHHRGARGGLPPYFSIPTMTRSGGPNFLGARYAPLVVPDGCHEQGHEYTSSPSIRKAFDIHGEPETVREAYGRAPFGRRCLVARRLVEAGVPFITLNQGGWDHHESLFDFYDERMPPFEASLAALIEDLDRRGMLATTLVIALGEFGRTPKVNDRGGRDHWSNAMSALFAGGGTPGGQVIGATDARGYAPVDRVFSPANFAATVYTKLGIDPATILRGPDGRSVRLVSDPTPIRELMG